VIRFVYEHFGDDRVAMVCTINRYRRRSALRDVAKAHGLPVADINKLVESLPQRWYGPPPPGYREGSAFETLSQRYPSERHQAIFRDATALLDKPRHLSIHPGGVVIAPGRLTDLVPTLLASKGVVITQFDLDSIERLGLIKIDLLGIRGLTVLGDVAQTLGQPIQGVCCLLDALDSIPLDDPPTSELVRQTGAPSAVSRSRALACAPR
jgi:DNA polymerase III alpha subunit